MILYYYLYETYQYPTEANFLMPYLLPRSSLMVDAVMASILASGCFSLHAVMLKVEGRSIGTAKR